MKSIFIDTANLYYCSKKDFGIDSRINYAEYLKDCKEYSKVTAYITQQENESKSFIDYLLSLGVDVRIHTAKSTFFNPSCWMAVDVLRMEQRIDEVIIGSSDRSIIPLVDHLKNSGIKVTIFATGVPFHLVHSATHILKIEEKHLRRVKNG